LIYKTDMAVLLSITYKDASFICVIKYNL